ncbi:MAG: hypothetical protein QG625_4217 [Cyanobacteriota bacterium erpe_2018_sw_39hr_WHONDRS-SW48-000098_B_bin.30]|nr:hypothetical protein [Cyanobacteriota bacterium erpe_2018_sw_39hr_WHONDRS-SW48-000098_B_bin.30]
MNLKPALCLHILLICGVPGALAQTPAKPSQPQAKVAAPVAAKPSAPVTTKPATPVSAKPAASVAAKPAAPVATKPAAPVAAKPAAPVAAKPVAKTTVKSKAPRVGRAGGFVPPPPPSTPSFLADPAGLSLYYGAAMPLEFLSRENLKEKDKEIGLQLNDAKRELDNKKRSVDQRRERAVNFEALFQEGVISRRELENAQNEANDSGSEILRLESKVAELQNLKDRINKRLQAANPQAKSQKRKLIH